MTIPALKWDPPALDSSVLHRTRWEQAIFTALNWDIAIKDNALTRNDHGTVGHFDLSGTMSHIYHIFDYRKRTPTRNSSSMPMFDYKEKERRRTIVATCPCLTTGKKNAACNSSTVTTCCREETVRCVCRCACARRMLSIPQRALL